MTAAFGTDLLSLIRKHYPAALDGDGPQASACSAELAIALGGVLAFALKFGGPRAATRAVDLMVEAIVENAQLVDSRCGEQLRGIITRARLHA